MTPPINIDGTQITGATIDGTDVSAITVDGTQVFSAISIVDSFEDGGLSEYGGDTGAYSVISSNATDGSNALELDNPTTGGAGSLDGMASTSGLNKFPSRGDIFKCDWKPTQDIVGSGNRVTVAFGTQGTSQGSDCYVVSISPDQDLFGIGNGQLSAGPGLKSETLGTLSTNTQYFIEVEWGSATNNDEIVARLVEKSNGAVINEVTVSNSLHDSGGIGFGVNQGSGTPQCVYDFFRITDENAV